MTMYVFCAWGTKNHKSGIELEYELQDIRRGSIIQLERCLREYVIGRVDEGQAVFVAHAA
jgi:hypothetical protein